MFSKLLSIVVAMFGTATPAVAAECDLSNIVSTARGSLANSNPAALLTITSQGMALVVGESDTRQASTRGGTRLLELRENVAVEVGVADVVNAAGLQADFAALSDGSSVELVIGSDQAILLGNMDCAGVDWQARQLSPFFYTLDAVDAETRFTAAQVYAAVLNGQDLREDLMPQIDLDVRRGERLSERLPELSQIQSSLVIRPISGRLSKTEVHVPTLALRYPAETWLSDEIRQLSRVEDADWRLGRPITEFHLNYSDLAEFSGGVYFAISDLWSAEFDASATYENPVRISLERAFILPEQDIYGSFLIGQLGAGNNGVAIAAALDLGRSQLGGLLSVGSDGLKGAALFERTFGIETNAWVAIEATSAERDLLLGLSHSFSRGATIEVSLSQFGARNGLELGVGLTIPLSSARLALEVRDRTQFMRTLKRNAAVISAARQDFVDTAWPSVLE